MPHHAQGFRCVTRDQNTLAMRKQMPDEVADSVGLACSWRALHEHSTVFFQLPRNSYLLRICRLAQEDVSISLTILALLLGFFLRIRNWESFPNKVQKDPRQVL